MKTSINRNVVMAGLLAALLGTTAAIAFPGGGHHREHNPEKRMEKMLDAVDASAEQRAAIHGVLEAQKPNRQALREQSREVHKQARTLDPLSGDYLQQVEVIAQRKGELSAEHFRQRALLRQQVAMNLTETQRAKLAEMKEQRRQRYEEKRRERRS